LDLTAERYCREIEAYLCRKNDGHLVRIVGPAFEQVCGWAMRGVPLRIAQRGIDRYFERYYAKGPRRRPVRVEFCEADVLDVFDEWRRAVGVTVHERADEPYDSPEGAADPGGAGETGERARPSGSLPAHLDRVIARLTALRAGADRAVDALLDAMVQELDDARATAKGLRGGPRQAFLERLAVLDRMLMEAARARCDAATLQQLSAEADAELAPFRGRMPAEAYQRSHEACLDRAIRERLRLPVVAFD
jgi:hypothetical protein